MLIFFLNVRKMICYIFFYSFVYSLISCNNEGSIVPHYQQTDEEIFFACRNKLIAHRGASGITPENTMLAFETAKSVGFEYIEMDIWKSKDGIWVLSHENDISRTSNGVGNITEMTYAELMKYNFGYPKRWGAKFNQKIVRLEEFIEWCKLNNIKPHIEIKQSLGVEDASDVLLIVKKSLSYSTFAIHSFFLTSLNSFRKIDNKVILGYDRYSYNVKDKTDVVRLAPCYYTLNITNVDMSLGFTETENSNIYTITSSGIKTFLWAVDNDADINKLIGFNNIFVTTNIVPKILKP